jgi:hypothetical protein
MKKKKKPTGILNGEIELPILANANRTKASILQVRLLGNIQYCPREYISATLCLYSVYIPKSVWSQRSYKRFSESNQRVRE